jgi:chorismate dehydratase
MPISCLVSQALFVKILIVDPNVLQKHSRVFCFSNIPTGAPLTFAHFKCTAKKYQRLDQKIKVGAVSYLNTMPLLYGIDQSLIRSQIDLSTDFPSAVAESLIQGTIDIGLVPVAIIPHLAYSEIITDYCIGADGPVASVCLFSQVPLEEITTVLLDYQSRTSVALAKVLLKNYWKKSVVFKAATPGFEASISGSTAAVVIGDRALQLQSTAAYAYDLAKAWKAFTGLPFVFAAWVANKPIPANFVADFNEANRIGLLQIEKVVSLHADIDYDLKHYFTQNISYHFNKEKKAGLELFLSYLQSESFAAEVSMESNNQLIN